MVYIPLIAACSWGGYGCGLGVPELQFEKLATLLTDCCLCCCCCFSRFNPAVIISNFMIMILCLVQHGYHSNLLMFQVILGLR